MKLAHLVPDRRDGHLFFHIVPDDYFPSASSGPAGSRPVAPAPASPRGVMTKEPGP